MSSSTPTQPTAALSAWLNARLAKEGWQPQAIQNADLAPLQTEASFRQFYRVSHADTSVVLMDSPPSKERNAEFVSIAQALADADIQVPRVLAHDVSAGWLLLSDLGQQHYLDHYRQGEHARCLHSAVETLKRLAPVRHPAIEPYTLERLSDELDIFTDWLVVGACALRVPEPEFKAARELLLQNADDQPKVCVHRDFHCKNLLLSAPVDEQNGAFVPTGVLDFQDALIGPNGYDLASLLHDCYWRFDDRTIDTVIDRVAGVTRRSIDLLAVQRQLKAVGIFARLAQRDNKTSHLPYIAPVLKSLTDLCARHTELQSLGEWLHNSLAQPALNWVNSQNSL